MQFFLTLLATLEAAKRGGGEGSVPELVRRGEARYPDLFMTTPELVSRDGYSVEEHTVTTEDGYLLTMFRMSGRRRRTPVLLMHGLGGSSDWWFVQRRNNSLALLLADAGYDVWLGNVRGNVYSRRHISLTPEDPAFWTFSWHEMGVYDLPACMDHILHHSGADSLYYIGYSMGNAIVYTMLSDRPRYSTKLRLVVSLAPAAYMHHIASRVSRAIIRNRDVIWKATTALHVHSIYGRLPAFLAAIIHWCRDGTKTQLVCRELLYQTVGSTSTPNTTLLPFLVSRLFDGTSVLTLEHFSQVILSGRFAPRDFGTTRNQVVYGTPRPPEYQLHHVVVPTELHYSSADDVVTVADVELLSTRLPKVVLKHHIREPLFNHVDFVAHRDVRRLLYDGILASLARY